jgi:hypothetical protein
MNRVSILGMMGVSLIFSTAGFANDSGNSLSNKRHEIGALITCVKKRASEEHSSYRQAVQWCKDELAGSGAPPTTGPLVAAEVPAKDN